MVEVLALKIVFIFCLLISTGITGYLPLFAPSIHKNRTVLSIGNCFAAGIFIIVGISALLPDAQESFDEDFNNSMPLAYVLAVVGYLIIFFVENIIFHHDHHNHDHEISENDTLLSVQIEAGPLIKSKNTENNEIIPGIILTAALVVHSIFEGIAVGLLSSHSEVITLCTAILIHNIPAAIALGIKMQGIKN